MEYIGIIYAWVCTTTGKGYVGLSRSSRNEEIRKRVNTHEKLLYNRWKGHVQQATYNPQDYFHYAIRKYGPENFQGRILREFTAGSIEDIKKLVDEAEQECIEEHGTLAPNGYNLQKGGFSSSFHPDTCAKMQAKKQAFLNTDEGREWIKKCSESQLLYFQTEKGLTQAKCHSDYIKALYEAKPDIKTKISGTLMQYFNTPEGKLQIEKQKRYMTEFYMTDDGQHMRNQLSAHAKKRWDDTTYRMNQINKGKERFVGEEGAIRKEKLKVAASERMKDPERKRLLAEKTKAHFDKIGRKVYMCDACNMKCRDKTAYDKHCSSKTHTQIVSGLTKQEAQIKVQSETSKKISESNRLWAAHNDSPRKGVTHTSEANEKNRLAHLGKTLPESARKKLSNTIKEQYKKGERKNVLAKLTDEQVIYVRQNKGIIKQKELAAQFNISVQTISAIQNNLVYKHVEIPATVTAV